MIPNLDYSENHLGTFKAPQPQAERVKPGSWGWDPGVRERASALLKDAYEYTKLTPAFRPLMFFATPSPVDFHQ